MHHHLHISTPALFVIAAFILGSMYLLARLVWPSKPKETPQPHVYRAGEPSGPPRTQPQYQSGPAGGPWATPVRTTPYMQPMYPPGYNANNGLVEGMIIGELMAGNRGTETIIERESPYVPPSYDDSPSDGGGISYDSGSSDSSSSSDSGGVSIDW